MIKYIGFVPLLPLLGFFLLIFTRLPKRAVALVGCGSVGMAALVVLLCSFAYFNSSTPLHGDSVTLWTWISINYFQAAFSFYIDALTLIMLCVITGVGFLIHVYSAGYMATDPGYARYFAYFNLFIASMTLLVLADNLLCLFLGWEGVGLCSYLLIGFWYKDSANGAAAQKAFIVTRIGDTAMTVGFLVLFTTLGTLNLQEIFISAALQWEKGSSLATMVALLLLGGAVGKSAQLPLQTWLPDAMAGPTPVSALIHAATMVTAGVYLIARMHTLFELAPVAQHIVALVGLFTLLIAGLSALTQTDIKRILAYSTISQIGYMFLGLGVGAWSESIFHLMTHAFFKALLFLAAGSVIFCLHHKQNIFEMGGLWKKMPLTFISFMIGCASLASLPFITSGFYSKDEILLGAYYAEDGHWIFAGGVVGALITAIYSFRLLFVVFFGETKTEPDKKQTWNMQVPLILLGLLAVGGGAISLPLDNVLPPGIHKDHGTNNLAVSSLLVGIPIVGLAIAWWLFNRNWFSFEGGIYRTAFQRAQLFLRRGWAFDWLYETTLVRPYVQLANFNQKDFIDAFYSSIIKTTQKIHYLVSATQTGSLRWYASAMVFGLTLLITVVVTL